MPLYEALIEDQRPLGHQGPRVRRLLAVLLAALAITAARVMATAAAAAIRRLEKTGGVVLSLDPETAQPARR